MISRLFRLDKKRQVLLFLGGISRFKRKILYRRACFYFDRFNIEVKEIVAVTWLMLFRRDTILVCNIKEFRKLSFITKYLLNVYDVDYLTNANDCWDWLLALNSVIPNNEEKVVRSARDRFVVFTDRIIRKNKDKCFVFGTGPSLSVANELKWDDGYKICCNTIVKDKLLWNQLKPDLFVAGDALYHFSDENHAVRFREDLKKRMREYPVPFIYPKLFHNFIMSEFAEFDEWLIPIPMGKHKNIINNLKVNFSLPDFGNILSLLLLPLATNLSKNIYLWGFDGRSPNDKLFWKNSSKHSYVKEIDLMKNNHPAFFEDHVPKNNGSKYVNEVHGDVLDSAMCEAEENGYKFIMMHRSWTPTLQKRYDNKR